MSSSRLKLYFEKIFRIVSQNNKVNNPLLVCISPRVLVSLDFPSQLLYVPCH